jgi:hypothetical protein
MYIDCVGKKVKKDLGLPTASIAADMPAPAIAPAEGAATVSLS